MGNTRNSDMPACGMGDARRDGLSVARCGSHASHSWITGNPKDFCEVTLTELFSRKCLGSVR
jgi:hypothetical protein